MKNKKGKFLLAANVLNLITYIITMTLFFLLANYNYCATKSFIGMVSMWIVLLVASISVLIIDFLGNRKKISNFIDFSIIYIFSTAFSAFISGITNHFLAPDTSIGMKIGFGIVSALPMLFWLYLSSKLFEEIWKVDNE